MNRSTSRRAFLAGASALAPLRGASALATEPDPVFALIEAERVARDAFERAIAATDAAMGAFHASGMQRPPRALVAEFTATTRGPTFDPIPIAEQTATPIYAHDHAEIDRDCDRHAAWTDADPADVEARRARLHRELDEDAAAVEAAGAKSGLDELWAVQDRLNEAAEAALAAVCTATPTTTAGLLAVLALFEEQEGANLSAPLDGYVSGIFAAVRSIVGGRA